MSEQSQQFDDLELKAALRKLRGGGRASPELRDRVMRCLTAAHLPAGGVRTVTDSGKPVEAASRIPRWRHSWRFWLAVAAAVLLVIAGVWAYRYSQHRRQEQEKHTRNTALMGAIVAMHDLGRGPAPGLSPLAASLADPVALAAEARSRLGRSAPVASLQTQGWQLDAADFCIVGQARSVRFHFTRGDRSVSVLSIPREAYAGAEAGHQYATTISGHPIAGHIQQDSLICVVGDPQTRLAETVLIRNAMVTGLVPCSPP